MYSPTAEPSAASPSRGAEISPASPTRGADSALSRVAPDSRVTSPTQLHVSIIFYLFLSL